MVIKFFCPSCDTKIEAGVMDAGEEFPCPHCLVPIVVPMAMVGPNTALGGFRIIKKIGDGGMGEVYLARQTSLNREVALKVLHQELSEDEKFVRHFLSEIQVQGSLSHSNIVTAHDAGIDRDIFYLAMEYINGNVLEEMITEHGVLDEAEALRITREVAVGLEYAWKKLQIVHRDVKPGNIMITETGQVKLLDLGLSTSLVQLQEAGEHEAKYMVGTPQYISPEQARGDDHLDFRADIYSLGASLYHMLTRVPPHSGSSATVIIDKHQEAELQPPEEINADITPATSRLIHQMLEKNPHDRFSSWDRLIEAIDRILSQHQPSAKPMTLQSGAKATARSASSFAALPWKWLLPLLAIGVLAFLFSRNAGSDAQPDSSPDVKPNVATTNVVPEVIESPPTPTNSAAVLLKRQEEKLVELINYAADQREFTPEDYLDNRRN